MKAVRWSLGSLLFVTSAAVADAELPLEKWGLILMFHDPLTCSEAKKAVAGQPVTVDCPASRDKRYAFTAHYEGAVKVKDFKKILGKTKEIQTITLGKNESPSALFAPAIGAAR